MVTPFCFRTERSETKTTNSTYGEHYDRLRIYKIPVCENLLPLLKYIDRNKPEFVADLAEAVAIKSISGSLDHLKDVKKMIRFTTDWMRKLGIEYERYHIGEWECEGKTVKLPNIILASLYGGYKKKTLGIYCHLDVPEPDLKEWKTDPWTVTEVNKKLYGNGVAYGKGPLIAWFHAIQSFHAKGVEVPVNLKFIVESMNNCGSVGLEEFLSKRKTDFLADIDFLAVCDSEWLGEKIPCICHGSVGNIHFSLVVENAKGDPKEDIKKISERLVDGQENILIPKVNEMVDFITPDEEKQYEGLTDFDEEVYKDQLPEFKKGWDKMNLLMNFWRFPSLALHEIEECTCEKKEFTKARRDFTMKIVPKQIAEVCIEATVKYIEKLKVELKLEGSVECDVITYSRHWTEDRRSVNHEAARQALIQVYKDKPNFIKDDKDMRVVKILDKVIEENIVVLPLSTRGSNCAQANENIPLRNYYEGTKFLGAYLIQLGKLTAKKR